MRSMKKNYLIAAVILVVAVVAFVVIQNKNQSGGQVACTMEAKLCPDGSAVGRQGPNCEFTLCPVSEANIRVTFPRPNDEIGLPLNVVGEARVFESSFAYRLTNADGRKLLDGYGTADAPDVGQLGPFSLTVNYPDPETETGTLEVFQYSAKDGEEIDKVIVPVRFASVEATSVKVFFVNQNKDPKGLHCETTYPVTRRIAKTEKVATEAIAELLRGVTGIEYQSGYLTMLKSDVKLRSLTIENGVAKADFNEALATSGGSCLVSAVRSQIENTLKQFSSIKSVVISINGMSEDILQP